MEKSAIDSGALGVDRHSHERDNAHDQEAQASKELAPVLSHAYDSDEPIDPNAQAGVQKMEATANVWTKKSMILAYVLIWLVYFVDSMQQQATGVLTFSVTSAFNRNSLSPSVSIVSNIVGGVFKLTLAKVLDVFGRPQGYLLSIVFATLGLVMEAATPNIPTYAAAQVFYWVGMNGIQYSLTVTLADMSSLRNRGLVLAFATSPFIITAWTAGPISSSFVTNWRWGFGTFSIVTPCVTMPLFILMMYNLRKAKRLGVMPERKSERTFFQSLAHYAREFDVVGLMLLSFGLVLFLLPFNIYSYQKEQWRSPIVISFLIVGVLLVVAFFIWEKYFAPVTFIPYKLLQDRTVLGSCVFAACGFVSYYIWEAFFFQFLRVVNDLNTTHATYMLNIYNVGSCLWSFAAGLFIRHTGLFKPAVLFFGLPLLTLGVGLMINFRQPDVNIGYIVMCQIFVAFGGGTNVVGQEVAIMSRVSHQHVAVVLAVQNMAASIGGAIGLSVSAAVWQAVFPKKLKEYLPESAQANFTTIYGSYLEDLKYPVGSPTRLAIQHAFGEGQRMMLIAATAILAISFISVAFWHNTNVKNIKQTKGRVF